MYIVLEVQTNGNNMAIVPPVTRATLNEAESVYHQALASAAISSVEKHCAMVIDENGVVFDSKCYYHGVESPEET